MTNFKTYLVICDLDPRANCSVYGLRQGLHLVLLVSHRLSIHATPVFYSSYQYPEKHEVRFILINTEIRSLGGQWIVLLFSSVSYSQAK